MAILTIILSVAVTLQAVAPTMRVLYFTSIEYIPIAWSAVATIDRAWRC